MTPGSDSELDISQVVAFWTIEAEEALRVAEHLVEKADYSYALFFGHLAVEKILKALYVFRQGQHAPPLHNLVRLARVADLNVDEKAAEKLAIVSAFNLEARYPDFKRSFREICTPDYTAQQMSMIKELMQWLRSQLPSSVA
ncbi:MAG TPA: HEPN domain-containing protein [Anaerolineae bacterium]|nr:HEPN domain-containing protein [Anaerolineae bacterium]